ncbi:SPASM domain-containing protein [bacterium]|nr:SPASM domain-containing protein [bacterium]
MVERHQKVMGSDLFEKIVSEAAPLTDEVCLHLMGEPLLHTGFADFLEKCAYHALPVNLTTNGMLLNASREELLLNPIIRQVNFSLQSFEGNFKGQDISTYLSKIFSFTQKALVLRPDLYINFRLWNLKETSDAVLNQDLLHRIENEFKVTINPQVDVSLNKSKKLKGRLYLHFDSRFEWPNPNNSIRSETGFCHGLGSHIGIHADGSVVPCCLDKEAVINLGSVNDQSLMSILESPRAKAIHQGFQNGKLVEDLCKRCRFIERFDGKVI